MKKLSFKKILQESYVIQKEGFLGFFYIDNIVFTFKKNRVDKVKKIVKL